MDPQKLKDIGTTIGGAGAGGGLLISVQWSQVLGGETTKLLVALALIVIGYLMYSGKSKPNSPVTPPPTA